MPEHVPNLHRFFGADKEIKNFRPPQRILVRHGLAINHYFNGKLNLFYVEGVRDIQNSNDLVWDVPWRGIHTEGGADFVFQFFAEF